MAMTPSQALSAKPLTWTIIIILSQCPLAASWGSLAARALRPSFQADPDWEEEPAGARQKALLEMAPTKSTSQMMKAVDFVDRLCDKSLQEEAGREESGIDRADKLESEATKLALHWLLKQTKPKTFAAAGIGERALKIFQQFKAPVLSGESCDRTIVEQTVQVLDFWYFFTGAHALAQTEPKRPDRAWLECFIRQINARGEPQDAEGHLLYFLSAMELLTIVQSDPVMRLRPTASYVRSEAAKQQPALLSGSDARELVQWAQQAIRDAEVYFSSEQCVNHKEICGYYLTHRMFQLTGFLSKGSAATVFATATATTMSEGAVDEELDVTIADATHRLMIYKRSEAMLRKTIVPFLHRELQRKPDDRTMLDLASEVLVVLRFVCSAGEGDADVELLRKLLEKAPTPVQCHEAVTRCMAMQAPTDEWFERQGKGQQRSA
eukprot:TRINITY_DN38215_c0_g1_i1.p1 TRINITY_DN38215_c0_g1~~TRINITY_DN38215_c0_g1_i1.p1  ORF type:complete len:437 (+),score=116.27 TRINITY_DN38215_c0_g1_i1:112-1422(+)